MKTLTVRLPDAVLAAIEAEGRSRHMSKSDIVRERLSRPRLWDKGAAWVEKISDLIGSVDGVERAKEEVLGSDGLWPKASRRGAWLTRELLPAQSYFTIYYC